MALTPKQEKFCRCIASGMSAKDAYIEAYDTNAKLTTVYAESGKLMLREDIQNKIKALQKPLEQAIQIESVNARKQQIDFILERIAICRSKEDEQSIIRYTDMLNKIYGVYKEDTNMEENKNNLSNVDTDTLAKLVNAV